jgi:hypothetical protein
MFENPTMNYILIMLVLVFIWVFALRMNNRSTQQLIHQVARQQSLIRQSEDVRLLCRAIHHLYPSIHAGTDYIVSKDGPDQKAHIEEWLHTNLPQPTQEQLDEALREISSVDPVRDHAAQRRAEYPSVGDQLDAAWKARQGDHSEQQRLDAQIARIKEKYPKSDASL